MKITYYDSLYKREVTSIVCGEIVFKDGAVNFSSGGHRYRIELQYVRKIYGEQTA